MAKKTKKVPNRNPFAVAMAKRYGNTTTTIKHLLAPRGGAKNKQREYMKDEGLHMTNILPEDELYNRSMVVLNDHDTWTGMRGCHLLILTPKGEESRERLADAGDLAEDDVEDEIEIEFLYKFMMKVMEQHRDVYESVLMQVEETLHDETQDVRAQGVGGEVSQGVQGTPKLV